MMANSLQLPRDSTPPRNTGFATLLAKCNSWSHTQHRDWSIRSQIPGKLSSPRHIVYQCSISNTHGFTEPFLALLVRRILGGTYSTSLSRWSVHASFFPLSFLPKENKSPKLILWNDFLVLFTVSNLLITDVFPVETHALAGAVFNTVAQFGTSIGLAIMAVISSSVTQQKKPSSVNNESSSTREALLEGYRAVFWACLGCLLLTCCIGLLGLRKVGKLGLKKE